MLTRKDYPHNYTVFNLNYHILNHDIFTHFDIIHKLNNDIIIDIGNEKYLLFNYNGKLTYSHVKNNLCSCNGFSHINGNLPINGVKKSYKYLLHYEF